MALIDFSQSWERSIFKEIENRAAAEAKSMFVDEQRAGVRP